MRKSERQFQRIGRQNPDNWENPEKILLSFVYFYVAILQNPVYAQPNTFFLPALPACLCLCDTYRATGGAQGYRGTKAGAGAEHAERAGQLCQAAN